MSAKQVTGVVADLIVTRRECEQLRELLRDVRKRLLSVDSGVGIPERAQAAYAAADLIDQSGLL